MKRDGASYAGAVFIMGYGTGFLCLAGSIVTLLAGNHIAMGICLAAAALVFGQLANAVLRQ